MRADRSGSLGGGRSYCRRIDRRRDDRQHDEFILHHNCCRRQREQRRGRGRSGWRHEHHVSLIWHGDRVGRWQRNGGDELLLRSGRRWGHRWGGGTGGGVPGLPEAVAFGIDTAHTGAQPNETIYPPLQQRWAVTLGDSISYPLIAGGRVFVTVRPTGAPSGTHLYAFDLQTGTKAWGPLPLGGDFWSSNAAYEAGRVFATNQDGALRAFDAASGVKLWEIQAPLYGSGSAPPTARGGRVYFTRSGPDDLIAVDAKSGAVLWSAFVTSGYNSSPVVTDTGVYVSHDCNQVYDFRPVTGALLWHYQTTPCSSGGGYTAVLFDGKLYTRASPKNLIHDATTGDVLGTVPTPVSSLKTRLPAFHGGLGFFILDSGLVAKNVSTLETVWSLAVASTETLSAPIVVNGVVYVLSTTGELRALAESDGALLWSTDTGGPIPAVDEYSANIHPLTGLAAGGGALVVPAGKRLIAYW